MEVVTVDGRHSLRKILDSNIFDILEQLKVSGRESDEYNVCILRKNATRVEKKVFGLPRVMRLNVVLACGTDSLKVRLGIVHLEGGPGMTAQASLGSVRR